MNTTQRHQDDSNLALELDTDSLIPVLDEQVLEKKILEKINAKSEQGKFSKDEHSNPFLPYAHLEQLAKERTLFRKELEQFTHNMKHTPASYRYNSGQANSSQLSALAAQIKKEIIQELQPVIESKIRALVKEQINAFEAQHDEF